MEMEPQLEEMHPDELEDIRAHRLAVQEQLQRCDSHIELSFDTIAILLFLGCKHRLMTEDAN